MAIKTCNVLTVEQSVCSGVFRSTSTTEIVAPHLSSSLTVSIQGNLCKFEIYVFVIHSLVVVLQLFNVISKWAQDA